MPYKEHYYHCYINIAIIVINIMLYTYVINNNTHIILILNTLLVLNKVFTLATTYTYSNNNTMPH